MSTPVTLTDRNSLLQAASTSLSSKIVSQYTNLLGPIAVDAVTRVINPAVADNVDLNDIRIVKKVGGTLDDTELVDGLVLTQNVIKSAGGPTRMEKAKIGFIQFQLSPPKPDVCVQSRRCYLRSLIAVSRNRWKTRLSSTTTARWIRFSRRSGRIC